MKTIIVLILLLSFAIEAKPVKIYNDYPGKTLPILTTAMVKDCGDKALLTLYSCIVGWIEVKTFNHLQTCPKKELLEYVGTVFALIIELRLSE